MARLGADRAGCLCWTGGGALPSEYTLIGDGDCREIKPNAATLSAFQALVGYRPQGDTLAQCFLDCFIGGSDVDGESGPLPMVPSLNGWMDLWLPGHSRVLSERFEWGRPGSRGSNHTAKIRQLLRKQFAGFMDEAQKGKLKDAQHHRRILDAMCEKYGLQGADDWRELVPTSLQKDVPGRLKHETSISDNCTPQLTWTDVTNGIAFSGVARGTAVATGNDARVSGSDLSSADHYAQAAITTLSSGPALGAGCARFSGSAATYYFAILRNDGSSNYTTELRKFIAGASTTIAGPSASSFTTGDVMKTECNGTTINGYKNGASVHSVTDSSISSNVKTGLRITPQGTATVELDDFAAADLGTVGPVYTQLERSTRGLNRGMYTRWG